MIKVFAKHIKVIEVTDPDTGATVEVEIFKDPQSGAIFGIDSTFLVQQSEQVYSPYNGTQKIDCSDTGF